MKGMRFQTKLLVLTIFWSFALVINLVGLGYLAFSVPSALKTAEQISFSQQRASLQMRAELRDAEAALYRYLMEGEPGFKLQFEHHLQAFQNYLADYEQTVHTTAEKKWIEQLQQNYASALDTGHALITLRDQQNADLQKLEKASYTANTLLAGPVLNDHSDDPAYQHIVSEMQSSMQEMLLAITAYLNTHQTRERTRFSDAAIRFYQAEQQYKSWASTSQQRDWDRMLQESFASIQGTGLHLISGRDQQMEKFASFAAILFHMGEGLLLKKIQPMAEQNLSQTWANLLGVVRFVLLSSFFSSATVFLLAVALTTPLVREVNTGIRALLLGADRISSGNLTEPVPVPKGIELRRLAKTFNVMMQELSLRERRLKRRLSELEALREVSLQLTSTLDPAMVFETIAQSAVRLVSAEEVHIFMFDANSQTLQFMGSAWRKNVIPPAARQPRADGLVMQVAHSGKTMVANHAQSHPLFTTKQAQAWGIEAAAGFPLVVGKKVVGVLQVTVKDRDTFSDDDLQILELLADQAAVTVENTRLYQEVADREARLQSVLQKLAHVQEEERRLLGLDLHDGLMQLLISANMHLNAIDSFTASALPQIQSELAIGHTRIQSAIDEARRVIAELRPAALEELGLVDGLRQYTAMMSQHEQWHLEFTTNLPEDFRIPAELEVALFRIAQEALSNAKKHANTRQIQLSLSLVNGKLVLKIQDWGQGFMQGSLRDGSMRLGLLGMEERTAMFNGKFHLDTEPGRGVAITVEIPMPKNEGILS